MGFACMGLQCKRVSIDQWRVSEEYLNGLHSDMNGISLVSHKGYHHEILRNNWEHTHKHSTYING